MNILVQIDFPGTISRSAKNKVELNGYEFYPRLKSATNSICGIGEDKDFEVNNIVYEFIDFQDHFRNILSSLSGSSIIGSNITEMDESGSILSRLKLVSGHLREGIFEVEASARFGELESDVTEQVTLERFPSGAEQAFNDNLRIPLCVGDVGNGLFSKNKGTVKCPRIGASSYAVHPDEDQSITNYDIFTPSGTDVTSLCTIGNKNGVRCIIYSGTAEDYLSADFETGHQNKDPQDALEFYLNKFKVLNGGNYTSKSSLNVFLARYDMDSHFEYYTVMKETKGKTILKDFCNSFNVDWIINNNGEIEIKWIDPANLDPVKTFGTHAKILSFNKFDDRDQYYNKIFIHGHWNDYLNEYNKKILYNDREGQYLYGIKKKDLYVPWLKSDVDIYTAGKLFSLFNKHARQIVYISIKYADYESFGLGDLIKFSHPGAKTSGPRLYQVRHEEIDRTNDIVFLTLWDYTYLENINQNLKLLIQSDFGKNYPNYYDSSIITSRSVTPHLSPLHMDTYPIFGQSSAYFWGYRYLTVPDSTAWNILENTEDDFTLEMVLKVHDWSTTYATAGGIFYRYQDANNKIFSRLTLASQILQMKAYKAGVLQWNIATSTAMGTDKRILTIVKKGGASSYEIGLYLDGQQEAYTLSSSTLSLSASLSLCGLSSGSNFLQAYVQEIRVIKENVYNASPNSGKTDAIDVSWYPWNENVEVGKTLEVLTPQLTQNWDRGQTKRITWNIPGIRVSLELWDDTMTSKDSDISALVENDAFFDWAIGSGLSAGDYTIKIISEDGNLSAFSNVFTLT